MFRTWESNSKVQVLESEKKHQIQDLERLENEKARLLEETNLLKTKIDKLHDEILSLKQTNTKLQIQCENAINRAKDVCFC